LIKRDFSKCLDFNRAVLRSKQAGVQRGDGSDDCIEVDMFQPELIMVAAIQEWSDRS